MIVPAGRINKLFGTEGGVMLSLYPAFPEDFTTDTPLRVTIDALEVPLWCERFERRGQSGATATFADFDTERRAQELVGLEFRIEMNGEEDDDEFYLEDLIGFAVVAEEAGASSGSGIRTHAPPGNSAGRSPTTTTATPIRCSNWRSADGRCWSPPSRSSSPASTSRGARCTWCCPKDS